MPKIICDSHGTQLGIHVCPHIDTAACLEGKISYKKVADDQFGVFYLCEACYNKYISGHQEEVLDSVQVLCFKCGERILDL